MLSRLIKKVGWLTSSGRLLLISLLLTAMVFGSLGLRVSWGDENAGNRDDSLQSLVSAIVGKTVIRLGMEGVEAAGAVDYTFGAANANVQFLAALNALPATGGRLVVVSAVQVNWAAATTVTRAIDNVVIEGSSSGTYFVGDGATAIFTAGGNNWRFENFRTDAGGIAVGATTGWTMENVLLGATYYAYRTSTSIGAASVAAPTGRGSTLTVAASNASAAEIAQADYRADGTADDVEVLAALAALPATGGTVLLSSGNFTGGQVLIQRDNVNLKSNGGTIWKVADGTNAAGIVLGGSGVTTYENITVEGLRIDGNFANQVQPVFKGIVQATGILAFNVNDFRILNNSIYDAYQHGINAESSYNGVISGNYAENQGDDAIGTSEDSYDISIVGNTVKGGRHVTGTSSGIEIEDGSYRITAMGNTVTLTTAGSVGINVKRHDSAPQPNKTHDITVIGNTVYAVVDTIGVNVYDLSLNWATNYLERIIVADNILIGQTAGNTIDTPGIVTSYAENVLIRGNIIRGFRYGIDTRLARKIKIAGNVVESNELDSIFSGLDTTVEGNLVRNSARHGIRPTANNTRIIANTVLASGGGGIFWSSALSGVEVLDNRVEDSTLRNFENNSGDSGVHIKGNYFAGGASRSVDLFGDNGVFSNNAITTAGGTALYIQGGTTNILVSGNNIFGQAAQMGVRSGGTTDRINIVGNAIVGNDIGIGFAGGGQYTNYSILDNDLSNNGSGPFSSLDLATIPVVRGNKGYIAAGETRFASGALTAGIANAIAFSWHDPETQDIAIKKVVVRVTTGGGTVGSHLDTGIADDAAGTNRGIEFTDDLLLNNTGIYDSGVAAGGGTQTVWVFCQDSASATDGWVVGQILDADAAALVGTWYIEYVGL